MPLKIVRRQSTGALTIVGTVQGQRIRRRAQSDVLALAREEAAALEAELLRSAWHGDRRGSRSFGQAVVSYLSAQERPASTKAGLKRILLAIGDDLPLSSMNQEMVDQVRVTRLGSHPNPSTVKRWVIGPIRAVMLHAHRRGWCDAPIFESPRARSGRTLFMLPDEAERLIAAAAPHLKVLLTLLFCTGMRMSEALELEWRDVDLTGGRAILWPDQTKASVRRNVTLPPRAVATLENLSHRDGIVIRKPNGEPYADKQRQRGGQIQWAWAGAIQRAGLDPALYPHCTRHSWASWHYALHRDLLALKIEGGWHSVALVERYAHLLPAGHEDAIKRFWGMYLHDIKTQVSA